MLSRHIVVIDDDRDFITFMNDALSGEGYHVSTATTRDTGFELIRSQQPNLVILDVWMGASRSDQTLIDLLQTQLSNRHIPTIVCTADLAFLQDNGTRLKANGFMLLEKPFNIDDLFYLVERAMAHSTHSLGS